MSDVIAHWPWLVPILGMGAVTYATRLSGLLLMQGIVVKGRAKAALDALPPSVLTAVITPIVLMTGKAETIAAVITAVAAILRLPLLATMVIGMGSLWLLKTFGAGYL